MIKISNIKIRGKVLDLPITSQQLSVLAQKIAGYIRENRGKSDFRIDGKSIIISNIRILQNNRYMRIGTDRETILVGKLSKQLESSVPAITAVVRVL